MENFVAKYIKFNENDGMISGFAYRGEVNLCKSFTSVLTLVNSRCKTANCLDSADGALESPNQRELS